MEQILRNKTSSTDEIEIDLLALLGALWKRIWLILLAVVLCAVGAFVGTKLFVAPLYRASAIFYVNNNTVSISSSISLNDLNASAKLVDGYVIILKTRETLEAVADYADVNYSYEQLNSMVSADSVNSTEFFRIQVIAPDPNDAEAIARAIAEILPKRIASIIDGSSAKIVEKAVVPSNRYSPSYTKNAMIGGLVGAVIICAILALQFILDNKIHTEENIESISTLPILATIPNIAAVGDKKYYKYYKKQESSRQIYDTAEKSGQDLANGLVGSKLNFSASEAYKYLRTKVLYSFVDDETCHVIGVTSSIPREGKSLTAVNLAYSLALSKKNVLLIDGDMRLPSLGKKLGVKNASGLSNALTGTNAQDKMIQKVPCDPKHPDGDAFSFISAGDVPPNPGELLGSQKMQSILSFLRGQYDYIIIDLPPVSEVSDALIASRLSDGMLVVVRQNECTKPIMTDTLRQLEAVQAHLIGFVFNYVESDGSRYLSKYYKKKKYGKYYSKYSRYYYREYGRENSDDKKSETTDELAIKGAK